MALDPADYTRLFSLKQSLFINWYEVEERKRMGLDGYPDVAVVYIDGEFFLCKEDLDKYGFTNEQIRRVIDLIRERCDTYVTFAKEQEKDFSGADWDDLMAVFSRFRKVWGDFMRVIDVAVYASAPFEQRVHDAILAAGFRETDFDTLTHPLTPTYHQRRQKDLCLLKQGKLDREEFKRRWAWSQMVIFQRHDVDDTFIDEQLAYIEDPVKELARLERIGAAAKKAFDALIAKLPPQQQEDAGVVQRLLRIRDYRFEMVLRGAYALQGYLNELAQRLDVTYEQLIHLTPDEVEAKDASHADERIGGYAHTPEGLVVGEAMRKLRERFNPRVEKELVEGKGVSAGVASGPARIVRSVKELHKVRKGDVIVCDLTSPDYVAALKKVVAIVANIGGFTSHSAIVSREFGIPCVVGTDNATNAFRDGDILKVDGSKGVVRRVGRRPS